MKRFLTACVAAAAVFSSVQGYAKDFRDSSLTPRRQAELILKELTLDEKIAMMMDNSAEVARLGIRPYAWWNEALHGVGRAGFATVFPQAIGLAATFDDDLHFRVFDAISDEARAKYNEAGNNPNGAKRYSGLTFWTPNVNIFRDPRWGRGQETYGEDPYLTSVLGKAAVEGLQGPADSKYIKTIACAKHYAVHSGPEWNRHSFDAVDIDPRDLWETYLPAFKTLVDAGVGQVMCAYNRFDGEPCCSNKRLLNDILRNKWGYDKIVVSDCGAISDFHRKGAHETYPSAVEASAKAVFSGTDLECGSDYRNLREAYNRGLISEETIDKSLLRLLEARAKLGELNNAGDCAWNNISTDVIDSEKHKALALEAARKSMTLLKNNGILPLPKDARIVVMGANADDEKMQWGNYSGTPKQTVTILEGIRAIAGDNVKYIKGCDLVENKNMDSRFNLLNSDGKTGLHARYWNNLNYEGEPAAEETIGAPLNKSNGGATVFAPGVNLENFSARYNATFTPEEAGRYVMNVTADCGFRNVSVNGKKVIIGFGENNTQDFSGSFEGEKGKTYDIEVEYAHGEGPAMLTFDIGLAADYAANCGDADIVIYAGGISPSLEGEEMPVKVEGFRGGDRTSIELPKVQRDLIAGLKAQGKKIVFVNCSGSAVGLEPEDAACDAVLQVWYPGEAGGQAVAETIYGLNNPAGRLPVTFYKNDSQLPDYEDYDMNGRTYRYFKDKPLYAFGHGLSYTDFEYSKPKLSKKKAKAGESVTLKVDVANKGKRDGDEVVQVYVRNKADRELNKTLRAFRRVNVKSGKREHVEIKLDKDAFAFFNENSGEIETLPGEYEVMVGGASDKTVTLPLTLTEL